MRAVSLVRGLGLVYFLAPLVITNAPTPFNVLVVVNSDQYVHLAKVVRKSSQRIAVHDSNTSLAITSVPFTLDTSNNYIQSFEQLCNKIESSNVTALISLTRDRPSAFVVATISGYLGLPVLGYVPDLGRASFHVSFSF